MLRSVQDAPGSEARGEVTLYCLTRDIELAAALDSRVSGAITIFYNDSARLHQAIQLRAPEVVVIDAGAIRPELGDQGLAPEVAFVGQRAPQARLGVRPTPGAERLIAAEAGAGVTILPAPVPACVEAVAVMCGCG
jgi:hypothetical protein